MDQFLFWINKILYYLDNTTVAGIILTFIGFPIARHIYKKQKRVDREYSAKENVVESLILLEEHCKYVNQSIDRLANTYKYVMEENNDELKSSFIESLPSEINPMSTVLMYNIQKDTSKIESLVSIYFEDNKNIKNATQKVFDELKKWHDFIGLHAIGRSRKSFDLTKKSSEIPELSLEELNKSIMHLIKLLK